MVSPKTIVTLFWVLILLSPDLASGEEGQNVYVGVYLRDVTRFELKDGVFDVDLDLWAKWRGEFDPDLLQIDNAAQIERRSLGAERDGDWHSVRWRVRGTLRGEFPVHRFPFDVQRIAVVLQLPEQQGRLVPDVASSGMAESFGITDWYYDPEFRVVASESRLASDLGMLSSEGRPVRVRNVAYEVSLRRPIITATLKLFLPLAIIVLVALVALFLPGDRIDARSAIGITALLSCFAFQFTVANTLPDVAYITLADVLFLIAYVLSSAALIVSIVSHSLWRRKRQRAAVITDRVSRITLTGAATLAVWLAIPSPLPVPDPQIDPVPEMPRHESVRDVLRIGTSQLPSVTGSTVGRGVYWSLMPEPPGEDPLPVYVERRPGVDNDALRFLATGELEVAWSLRKGATWSDGQPITAGDLKLPWDAIEPPHVVSTKTHEDRTIVVRWDGHLAQALKSPTPWPSHVLGPVFDEGGYDAVRRHRRTQPMPTLGPYRVLEFERNGRVVAEANPHFPGSSPTIERIEERYFAEREELVRAFLDGEIDITTPNSITLEQAKRVAESRPDSVRIRPSSVLVVLNPDLGHPVLGRLELRRAILMAIDRERISHEVYGDAGRVAHVPVPGKVPRGSKITPHDAEKTRALIVSEGLEGTTIKLLHGPSPVTKRIVDLVKADLEAVGLLIETEETNPSKAYRSHDHGGLLVYPMHGSRKASTRRYWNLPLVKGNYPPDARHDAYTDEVHALVEREMHALYPERSEQLRDALIALSSERLPNLPLVFAAERVLAIPSLRGWDRGPEVSFGSGVERWHFAAERSEQAPNTVSTDTGTNTDGH